MLGEDGETRVEAAPLPERPNTAAPAAVRAAIKDRVLAQSLGRRNATATLDGRYRLLREIGRGGAGVVWEAEQVPLGRRVAVKLLRGRTDVQSQAAPRLLREALTASQIGHDHIVRVDDVGTDEHGSPYIAMELLAGESLARVVLARGRLPWSDVAAIALQICDALGAAHEIGVVHRDVKPANIFAIERDDGQWHCTLLDFGLCKPTAATETQLTAAGVFLGTPGYVAPEQIRGEFVDGRADIYGLGCVMAELLTGRPAFSGADRQAVVASQLRGWAPADVPPELEPLLRRALALNPQDRYPDVATFQRAIAGVGGNRPRARVEPSGLRRGYLLGVGTTVLCAAALALVGRSCVERRAAPVEPPTARPAPPPQSPAPPVPERVAEPSPPPRLAAAPPVEEAPPEPKPAPRPRPKRTRRAQPKRPPPAPPAPERAAFADGIRDPFAGL